MVANQLALRWEDSPALPGWVNIITRVLVSGRGSQSERTREMVAWGLSLTLPALKMRKRLWAKKCSQCLEAGKGKETNSSLELPERMQSCRYLDFSPVRPISYIFAFWMLSFKPTFSLSSFTFIKRLLSSSSLSAIRVVSSAYLRLLMFLPAILIPACASSSPGFLMMYSA